MEEIRIERTIAPKQKPDENHLVFGHDFTDHMFVMNWNKEQGWHDPRIVPFGPLTLSPACNCFHYGQETFEGLKGLPQPRWIYPPFPAGGKLQKAEQFQ